MPQVKRKYCILHTGRCGSTVLGRSLEKNIYIQHFGEILTPNVWISNDIESNQILIKRKKGNLQSDDFESLVQFISNSVNSHITCVGFELKFFQVESALMSSHMQMLDRLKAMNVVPFYLLRDNCLRRLISGQRARVSGIWHLKSSCQLEPTEIDLPISKISDRAYFPLTERSLIETLEYDQMMRQTVRQIASDHCVDVLTYEDIDVDVWRTARIITEKLGVEACARSKIDLKRTSPPKIANEVRNWEEVRTHLSGSQFEWMLEDCET